METPEIYHPPHGANFLQPAMKHYIAIDGVCAWPNLKRLSDGRIGVVHFNEPTHLRWEGSIDFRISSDGGRSWQWISQPVVPSPGEARGNVAFGVGQEDDLWILCGGWSGVMPRPGMPESDTREAEAIWAGRVGKEPLWPVCCHSKDDGKTWEVTPIRIPGNDEDFLWIPYGEILVSAGGKLACSMYSVHRSALAPDYQGTDGRRGSFYFESGDGGRTWECISRISKDGNETALTRTQDGRLLAAVRSDRLNLFASEDDGKSWLPVAVMTGLREFPGSFLWLREGYLMLAYGIRKNGFYGVGALLLQPESNKWNGVPLVLSDFGHAKDGGYPSSVQLENGEIVTAYYADSVPCHSRYHMGVKIWTLQEFGISPAVTSDLPK